MSGSMHEGRPDDDALVAALSQAARLVADEDAREPSPGAWHRLRRAAREPAGPGSRRAQRLLRGALAGAGIVATVVALGVLRRPQPLGYVVSGALVEANGDVTEVGATGAELAFTDGTRVRLARGARLSVSPPDAHGARLRLEEGEAHFEVAHLPGAEWSVDAGPYRVQVTGTVFDVRWIAREGTATVRLRVGSVRVTGPHLAAAVTLGAGQRLVATVATGELRLDDDDGRADAIGPPTPIVRAPRDEVPRAVEAVAPLSPPAPAVATPRPSPVAVSAMARRPRAPTFAPDTWASRVARGEATGVVAEARTRPFDAVVADADGAALAALADAARYSGDSALSERVLGELRRRFAGSPEAATAAFLLGRLADDRGDARAALAHYRRYCGEAPTGPYAAEALGREMLALERVSGRPAASALARDYVARFPDGTYLLQARAILGLP